jgi:excisionase family DNA binding protein
MVYLVTVQKGLENRRRTCLYMVNHHKGRSAMTKATAKTEDGRLVYTVPEAGAMLGLTRNGSYEAAKRGEIPTMHFGKLLRVPKAAFHKLLEDAGAK